MEECALLRESYDVYRCPPLVWFLAKATQARCELAAVEITKWLDLVAESRAMAFCVSQVMDGRLWHTAGENTLSTPRVALLQYYADAAIPKFFVSLIAQRFWKPVSFLCLTRSLVYRKPTDSAT